MAEIEVDTSVIQTAISNMEAANSKIDVALQTVSGNPFSPLCSASPDLGTHYVQEFAQSLADVQAFATSHVLPALQVLMKYGNTQPPNDDTPSGNYPSGGGPGGGNNDDGDGDTPSGPTVPVVPPEGPEVKPLDTTSLNDMTLEQVDGMVGTLKDMAKNKGMGIDQMLADESMADELKKLLMDSPYIPDELKALLKDADSQIVRKAFENIMKGGQPEVFDLNPLNIGIVYAYLMQIAEEKGITVEQLLSDPQYRDLLKTTLLGFEDVVELLKGWEDFNGEEYQAQLLKVYDGDGIADIKPTAVNIVRTFVDYVSEATDIGAEELLTDTKYGDILKTAAQQFGKTSVFVGATASYSPEGMGAVVSSLVDGTNAAALGMTNEEVTGFKGEIDALAKAKGVTSTELLSNATYAEDVKNALNESKNAAEIGTIYNKADPKVSQNVVKNLYNTEIKTTTTTDTTGTTTGTNTGGTTTETQTTGTATTTAG